MLTGGKERLRSLKMGTIDLATLVHAKKSILPHVPAHCMVFNAREVMKRQQGLIMVSTVATSERNHP